MQNKNKNYNVGLKILKRIVFQKMVEKYLGVRLICGEENGYGKIRLLENKPINIYDGLQVAVQDNHVLLKKMIYYLGRNAWVAWFIFEEVLLAWGCLIPQPFSATYKTFKFSDETVESMKQKKLYSLDDLKYKGENKEEE